MSFISFISLISSIFCFTYLDYKYDLDLIDYLLIFAWGLFQFLHGFIEKDG